MIVTSSSSTDSIDFLYSPIFNNRLVAPRISLWLVEVSAITLHADGISIRLADERKVRPVDEGRALAFRFDWRLGIGIVHYGDLGLLLLRRRAVRYSGSLSGESSGNGDEGDGSACDRRCLCEDDG